MGYVTTVLWGGILADNYGAKWVFGLTLLANAVLAILTPTLARWSYYAYIVIRVCQGMIQGPQFAALR